MTDEQMPDSYAKLVGERLRGIRTQKGFSLHDVEAHSAKEFKASVLGAYERGERSISVPRLQRLANFYGVPVDQLLPRLDGATIVLESGSSQHTDGGVRLDLMKLRTTEVPALAAVSRYAQMIQAARGDYNGRMLTIRGDDLRSLGAALGTSAEVLCAALEDGGVRLPSHA